MYEIGDIVIRDLSSLGRPYISSKENNAVGKIIGGLNAHNCYRVKVVSTNGSGYAHGAEMWWADHLMRLVARREHDWEV
jgi:hypothetical protein